MHEASLAPDPTQSTSNAIAVLPLQPHEHARWDAFVDTCPEATFFHRAGWQTIMEQGFKHDSYFLYAEQDGRIAGVLPLAHLRSRLFGSALVSLPFCVYGGIAGGSAAVRQALDSAALALARRLGVGRLEYRWRDVYENAPETLDASWLQKPLYATFRRPLLPDAEQNLLAIPRKQRAVVRKAMAAGLHSAIDYDISRFYPIYAASVHRLGTPVFARRHFALLRTVFGDACDILTVYHGQQAQASVLLFYFRDEVLPYYGGGSVLARSTGANDFMYWEAMRRACARGYRLFDFGRSKLGTGAWDFKKNWGFAPQPLPYAYKLVRAKALPDVNPLNPKYALFIRAWRRLPLPLANLLGPHIVRQLG
ncbi:MULTISPECIES: FemAB family XrtA/PEP-CTERM system-associated protein [unclassified Janthinobacterium]|uniref:FemAB family XrtA/PEP-CTERM system-associated protein n=1 Tax=unclassified Janthinobacterium TaxID=2610881 RepID=UPI001E531615|nr:MULTISPECIES: FemAB family XrtA/PEP-CTERM system-associated protein [unclassified Janthinobacterium]MCC7641873.1 FemAB family PEP-CTERM system-associated protein [Janthinobacterium sp. EB271-G4-3-1]MCC7689999.1 FemAB family PEP-CTERM system-associated protein [Janthinobacterium sp. EB271-G4-3-2]